MSRPGRLALVPPRYGSDIVGGAEAVFRELAAGLTARGWDVEVLTTCARDHFTWANELPAGSSQDGGITVRRFPTVAADAAGRARLEAAIQAGSPLSVAEQETWMNAGLRVPELFHHLLDESASYDAILFTPYMFWTTFAGAQVAPERTILWACMHDEPYLRLEIFEPMFAGVAGLLLQTDPEHELAHRVFPRLAAHEVVGCGMTVPEHYDPDGFRRRHRIEGRFVLYVGRREGAKGWEGLLDAWATATRRHDLPFKLVVAGSGAIHPPADLADRIVDVGVLDDAELASAYAAADAYLQPSVHEAFSRSVMEAWLAGTLVIGNGGGEVVRWHCERSGAGLTYDSPEELAQCLAFVAERPKAAAAIAAPGRQYVLDNYRFDDVLDRIEVAIKTWSPSAS